MEHKNMNTLITELTEIEKTNILGGEITENTSFWHDAAYLFVVGFKISLLGKAATAMT